MHTKLFCTYLLIFLFSNSPAQVIASIEVTDKIHNQKNILTENTSNRVTLLFNDSLDLYILKSILANQITIKSKNQAENYTSLGQDLSFSKKINGYQLDNKISAQQEDFKFGKLEQPNLPEVHNPIYNIAVTALRGVLAGVGEGYRIKEQYTSSDKPEWKHYGTLWHDYAMVRDAATIGVGVAIAEYSKLKFWKFVQGAFTAAAVNFITFQMSYNATLGEPLFRQSKYTTSRMESLASFPVMGLILATAIALEIYF